MIFPISYHDKSSSHIQQAENKRGCQREESDLKSLKEENLRKKKLDNASRTKAVGRERRDRDEHERSRHLFIIMSEVHTAAETLCSPPFPRILPWLSNTVQSQRSNRSTIQLKRNAIYVIFATIPSM